MRRWWRSSRSAASASWAATARDDGPVLGEHLAAVAGLGQAEQAHAVELPARALAQPPGDLAARQVAEQLVQVRRRGGRRPRRRRRRPRAPGRRGSAPGRPAARGERRCAAIRTAPTSSASRTKCASATACSSMSVTNVPSCGTIATSRSSRRRASASRTGVRLTPISSASWFSERRRPGSSSALTIALRKAAYAWSRADVPSERSRKVDRISRTSIQVRRCPQAGLQMTSPEPWVASMDVVAAQG